MFEDSKKANAGWIPYQLSVDWVSASMFTVVGIGIVVLITFLNYKFSNS